MCIIRVHLRKINLNKMFILVIVVRLGEVMFCYIYGKFMVSSVYYSSNV